MVQLSVPHRLRGGLRRAAERIRKVRRLLLLLVGGTGQEVGYRVLTHPDYYPTPTAIIVVDDRCEFPELRPYFVRVAKKRAKTILRELLQGTGRFMRFAQHLRFEELPEIKKEPGAHQEGPLGYFYFLCTLPYLRDPCRLAVDKLLAPDLAERCRAEGYELEEDLLYVIVVRSACGGQGGGSLSLPVGLVAREALWVLGRDDYDILDDDVRILDLVCGYEPFLGLPAVDKEKLEVNTGVFLADLLRQALLEPGQERIEVEGLDGEIERIPEGIQRLTFWLSGRRSSSDEQFAAVVHRESVFTMMADFVVRHIAGNLVSKIYDQYSNLTTRATVRGQPAILNTFGMPEITFDVEWLQELLTWARTERILGHALYGKALPELVLTLADQKPLALGAPEEGDLDQEGAEAEAEVETEEEAPEEEGYERELEPEAEAEEYPSARVRRGLEEAISEGDIESAGGFDLDLEPEPEAEKPEEDVRKGGNRA